MALVRCLAFWFMLGAWGSAFALEQVLPAITADDFRLSGMNGMGLGVLSAGKRPQQDLDALAATGARHVRVFISGSRCPTCLAYEASEQDLAVLRDLLKRLRPHGIYVVLVLGIGPDARGPLWKNEAWQTSFVDLWVDLARKMKGDTGIAGFDLLNEPVPDGMTYAARQATWLAFATRVGKAIRQVDPSRVLIVESAPDATPHSFDSMKPIALSNVVYSVHSYHPMEFTHQLVMREYSEVQRYPAGHSVSEAALKNALDTVATFAKRYDVPIYVGEFSAVRTAPNDSAARYVDDSVRLFQAQGWSWSYHEFRGWNGWDPELDSEGRRRFDAPVLMLLRDRMKGGSK